MVEQRRGVCGSFECGLSLVCVKGKCRAPRASVVTFHVFFGKFPPLRGLFTNLRESIKEAKSINQPDAKPGIKKPRLRSEDPLATPATRLNSLETSSGLYKTRSPIISGRAQQSAGRLHQSIPNTSDTRHFP